MEKSEQGTREQNLEKIKGELQILLKKTENKLKEIEALKKEAEEQNLLKTSDLLQDDIDKTKEIINEINKELKQATIEIIIEKSGTMPTEILELEKENNIIYNKLLEIINNHRQCADISVKTQLLKSSWLENFISENQFSP